MKKLIWTLWILITLSIAAYYLFTILVAEDKSELLIGDTSHGHFQIELACSSCHSDAFGGEDVLQNACVNCHAQELEDGHDSHPKKKFNDPRNVDRLAVVDARYCVSCHTEHKKEQTHPMGLSLPTDYCYHCHQDVGENRKSHKDLAFDSCASAGCHNYHDNRALYETFLLENQHGQWLKEIRHIEPPNLAAKHPPPSTNPDLFAEKAAQHPDISQHLQATRHGQAGISCGGCHSDKQQQWIEQPSITQCKTCHSNEASGFSQGKHGMRLAQGLTAISPQLSQSLAFKNGSLDTQHGCNSCHSAHNFDVQFAATEACLGCHNDEHSLAFEQSPHANIDPQTGSTVSCASCHMPRLHKKVGGETIISVQHNQNDNLRPNEKMIRPVCMQCHSLAFSIDALADKTLIQNNFNGQPQNHIPSIDWAVKRDNE